MPCHVWAICIPYVRPLCAGSCQFGVSSALQMISQMVEQGVRHADLLVLQGRALTDMGLVAPLPQSSLGQQWNLEDQHLE